VRSPSSFPGPDYLPLLSRYDNLVIGRTFSKAYALAGLRVGYAIPSPMACRTLQDGRNPPCVERGLCIHGHSSPAGTGACQQDSGPRYAVEEPPCHRMPAPVLPSCANFVLIDTAPYSGDDVTKRLAEMGVLVRSGSGFPGLPPHYIRVSIGEDWEMEAFLQAVHSL